VDKARALWLKFGCPSIRTKALSRHTFLDRWFQHRVVTREGGGPKLWKSHGESFLGERIVPPPIDTAKTATMILLCESRFASGRERPISPSVCPPWRTPGPPAGETAIYDASAGGGLYYYRHNDGLGSARVDSTPSQTFSSITAYAPFGEPYAASGAGDKSFTGQEARSGQASPHGPTI
jgi:hypothetical protein